MKQASRVALAAVRVTGVTQVVLGILFWTGLALSLIPLHMAIGLAFVLSLWVLAAISLRAGASQPLAAFIVLWGGLVIALGVTQRTLLPGPMHWIVRVLHLLVGIAAMVLANRLSSSIDRARPAVAASSPASDRSARARKGAGIGIGSR